MEVEVTDQPKWDSIEDYDGFLLGRGNPVSLCMSGMVDDADLDFQTYQGLTAMIKTREGATFRRIANDVFLIPVIGGQFLHDDRHIATLDKDERGGFSEHTWNLVIEGSDDQLLLIEIGEQMFEHFTLNRGEFIYMNTMNRHMISRKHPKDVVVIVQVTGFDNSQHEEAMARLTEVLRDRPVATSL